MKPSRAHHLALDLKEEPTSLFVIDGRPIASGAVTHTCRIDLDLSGVIKTISLDATQLGTYPIILGMPWLRKQNPLVDWRRNRVVLHSPEQGTGAVLLKGLSFVPSASVPLAKGFDIGWMDSHQMLVDSKDPDTVV